MVDEIIKYAKIVQQPIRLRALYLLTKGDLRRADFLKAMPELGQKALDLHLDILVHNDYVTTEREGRRSVFRLTELGEKVTSMLFVDLFPGSSWDPIFDADIRRLQAPAVANDC